MRAPGLDQTVIDTVKQHLDIYRLQDMYPPPSGRISELLEERGIPDTKSIFSKLSNFIFEVYLPHCWTLVGNGLASDQMMTRFFRLRLSLMQVL